MRRVRESSEANIVKQAVILAAGEGQRLRPFTATKPKAMLSVADKPVLAYIIEALAQNGISDIILVVGYKKEKIFDYFGAGEKFGVKLTYVIQEKQLGTAHALAQAEKTVGKEFLVLSGDRLIDAGTIAQFIHVEPQSLLVKMIAEPLRYGIVISENNFVRGIVENPVEAVSNLINTGIYAFNRDIFHFIDSELNIPDALNNFVTSGYHLKTVETEGTWLDIVYPWDIISLNSAIIKRTPGATNGTIEHGVTLKGQVSIGKDTIIHSNSYIAGPVVIGEGCEIGPNACIMAGSTIAHNVVVAPFSDIENSVIGDDVSIGPSTIIQDSVIDRGCVIGGDFTACSEESRVIVDEEHHLIKIGVIMGENCVAGSSVTIQPGTIIGNNTRIKSLKLVSGTLPDRSIVV